jgi:hypothetical protein
MLQPISGYEDEPILRGHGKFQFPGNSNFDTSSCNEWYKLTNTATWVYIHIKCRHLMSIVSTSGNERIPPERDGKITGSGRKTPEIHGAWK